MSPRFTSACLLALSLLAPGPASAQDPDRLELAVAAAIRSCTHLTIFDHVVSRTEDGTVTLDGKVTSTGKKSDIGRRVLALEGVREVRNDIAVLPPSPADDDLRYRIARAIYGTPPFWSYAAMAHPPIHIIVEDGHVTLAGVVNSNAERAIAQSLASGKGERSLTSQLRTSGR